jgi:hypothetical protein
MSEVLFRPIPIRIARFLLTEDWYACDTAVGNLLGYFPDIDGDGSDQGDNQVHVLSDANIEEGPPQPIQQLLYDVDGMISWDLAAVADEDGAMFIPAGFNVKCYLPEDAADGHWELLKAGQICLGSEGGSEEEGSEEEGTEEEDSEKGSETSEAPETSEGEGSGPCVTPADMGWPSPPGNGVYSLGVSNGCVKWIPARPCSPGS